MSITQCCLTKTFHQGTPTGKIEKIHNLNAYTTGNPEIKDKVYFLFTDIYGYEFKNTQLVADFIAKKTGYYVIVPDLFNGDAVALDSSLENTLKVWFPKHPMSEIIAFLKPWVAQVKADYKVTYAVGAGYCFGAPIVLTELGEGGYLDAGAVAHPSLVTPELVELVKRPIVISGAQTDGSYNVELRHKAEDILIKNEVTFETALYSKVSHGFSIKGDLADENVRYATDRTFASQVSFFKRFE